MNTLLNSSFIRRVRGRDSRTSRKREVVATAIAVAGVAISAYSAYSTNKAQKKAAKAAAQPQQQTSVRTPYMDETIRAMAPWVLNEGINNYANVNRQLGGNPTDYGNLTKLLQRMSNNYAGNAAGPAGIQGGIDWRNKLREKGIDPRSLFGDNLPEDGGNLNLWGARSNYASGVSR